MTRKPFRLTKRHIIRKTADGFYGRYRGHEISIVRESNPYIKPWYIIVTAPTGCYAYDGWWGEDGSTIDEAIEQALRGACLIESRTTGAPV